LYRNVFRKLAFTICTRRRSIKANNNSNSNQLKSNSVLSGDCGCIVHVHRGSASNNKMQTVDGCSANQQHRAILIYTKSSSDGHRGMCQSRSSLVSLNLKLKKSKNDLVYENHEKVVLIARLASVEDLNEYDEEIGHNRIGYELTRLDKFLGIETKI
jgi:hypothetical protein